MAGLVVGWRHMSENARRYISGGILAIALAGSALAQPSPQRPGGGAPSANSDLPTEMMMLTPPTRASAISPPPDAARRPAPNSPTVTATPSSPSPTQSPTERPSSDVTNATELQLPPPAASRPAQAPNPGDMTAFNDALRGLLPLTPDMIRDFGAQAEAVRRAAARPAAGSGVPVTRSIALNLRPGEALPRINLAAGNVSALVFADQTGAPWPVQSVTVANSDAYQAVEAGEKGKTNMVVISPKQHFATGNNLIVTLVNHNVPLVFTLDTGAASVDYRVDVTIQARGPNAAPVVAIGGGLAPTDDAVLRAFADGTPPRGARALQASRQDVEVWRHNDTLYVRTPLQMLSPAWVGYMAHPTGVRVYTIPDNSRSNLPVLYLSQDGRTQFVTVSERRAR